MKRTKDLLAGLLALLLVALCVIPYLYLLGVSFFEDGAFSLQAYYEVFLSSRLYLRRFCRSLALSVVIAGGQVLVSMLAGYAFAKCKFPGRRIFFYLLMLLMILPVQVTLAANYSLFRQLDLLNTYYCLALPSIFVPLGTFLMTRSFQSVPNEIIEAAQLDGCNLMRVIFRIAGPMNKSGLVCTMLLSFLDSWNMVEQPLAYLKDFMDYPLSVGLAAAPPESQAVRMACCVLVALPPLFLFAYYNQELLEGIVLGGEK